MCCCQNIDLFLTVFDRTVCLSIKRFKTSLEFVIIMQLHLAYCAEMTLPLTLNQNLFKEKFKYLPLSLGQCCSPQVLMGDDLCICSFWKPCGQRWSRQHVYCLQLEDTCNQDSERTGCSHRYIHKCISQARHFTFLHTCK